MAFARPRRMNYLSFFFLKKIMINFCYLRGLFTVGVRRMMFQKERGNDDALSGKIYFALTEYCHLSTGFCRTEW